MERKAVSGIVLTLLLIGMLTLAFNIQPAKLEPLEAPVTQWSKTYGGTGLERAYSVTETTDGGYALFGITYSFGAGSDDMWLVKTDANGNEQWNKTFGGTDRDVGRSVVQTNDGGFILAGATRSFGAGDWDIWLVKTDANGNLQWDKTLGGTGFDVVDGERTVIQTSDGGYAIAGYTFSFNPWGIWLIKTDPNGNMQWSKTYQNGTTAVSIVEIGDGGYALAGSALDGVSSDFLLVKTDSTGNMQWNKTYGGSDYDHAHSLVQTTDGGYALTGETRSFGAGNYDVWLVKTDAYGNMQWNRTYGGTEIDDGRSLVQTNDGGFAIACRQSSFGAGLSDFWLVKTDSVGNVQWERTYGGVSYDYAWSLVQTADGGYALAGDTSSFGAGGSDFWLIKLGPPVDDLSIVNIEPIQVIRDARALILNKKTVLRVEIFSTYSSTQNVDIDITFNFGMPPSPLTEIGVQIEPGLNTLYLPRTSFLYWSQIGTDDNIKVRIQPLPDEADPNNNEKIVSMEIVDTHSLSIAYYKVEPLWPANYGSPTWSEYLNTIDSNTIFITASYPISENKLSGQHNGVYHGDPIPDFGLTDDILSLSFYAWLAGTDRGVGVVSDVYFPYHNAGSATVGIMTPSIRGAALIREGYWIAAAHEIGHTYGLNLDAEEYDINPPGNRADGFWVSEHEEIVNGVCFMGYSPSKHTFVHANSRPCWVCKESYDLLYNELKLSGASTATTIEQMILFVRGYLYKNGTAELKDLYLLQNTPVLSPDPGNYSIRLVDSTGQTISETPFIASFEINVNPVGIIETDVAGFSFSLPWHQNATEIEIVHNGSIILERQVTPNIPSVEVTSPNGGEILEGGVTYTITWNALDMDGDTLTYSLAYSSDGGQSWVPLAIDVGATSYAWNTSYLQSGTGYIIKVIASDGVNTAEDISDSNFTVKVHDVSTTDVTSSKVIVGRGYNTSLNVTVANVGDFEETFNVTVYANTTLIETKEITLIADSNTTITFEWNTTGFAYGNYTIKAFAVPVELEFHIDNNSLTFGTVLVTISGDVNGDRIVDIFDIGYVSAHWYPGPPVGPLGYDANADVNNDGGVDIFDIGIVSSHWGESW